MTPIKKRKVSGAGFRRIDRPREPLSSIQRRLRDLLTNHSNLSYAVFGGVGGRSAVTCATLHVGQPVLVGLDIQDFFPSITERMVRRVFFRLGSVAEVAGLAGRLLTITEEARTFLPQGSPASPVVSNLVLAEFDRQMEALGRSIDVTYTRYFDNINFSGVRAREMIRPAIGVLRVLGFRVRRSKTTLLSPGSAQVMLGLNVNVKTSPSRTFRLRSEKVIGETSRVQDLEALQVGCLRLQGRLAYARHSGGTYWRRLASQVQSVRGRLDSSGS